MARRRASAQPGAELQDLRAERQHLLDELEMAYRQMERILTAAGHETRVAYEELGRRNVALQQRVVELERAQAELREAQRMLLQAERLGAMGQMAATIVHEINSPLAVITGHAELILMGQVDAETRSGLESILGAACRLRDLAQNTLRFARHHPTHAAALDLSAQAAAALAFLGPVLRDVQARRELSPDMPPAEASSSCVEQVLVNFLMNARDAVHGRPQRHVVVRTRVATLAELLAEAAQRGWETAVALPAEGGASEARCGVVEVEDNGTGIPGARMPRIFEAFYTSKGEGSGTGLGLAIARNIARELRGNILACSRPEQGTCFALLLPLSKDRKPEP